MALVKELLEVRENGEKWYDLHSDTEGKCVLQVETGILYGGVAMREDDPHTYVEADDPNWDSERNEESNLEDTSA